MGWGEIKNRYTELSGGAAYGRSTLPNRHRRLVKNFVTIREEDSLLIVAAKLEVDAEMANEKWGRVAQKVVEKGGGSYDGPSLQTHFSTILQGQGFEAALGLAATDNDFDVPEDNDEHEHDSQQGSDADGEAEEDDQAGQYDDEE